MALKREFIVDKLRVVVHDNRRESGAAASETAVRAILEAIGRKGEANVIFAAAPSQDDLLAALKADKRIPWGKVNAFHLDEYHTLRGNAPQRFDAFLRGRIWDEVRPGRVFPMVPEDGMKAPEIQERYKKLMEEYPPDLELVGVGENGHLAFVDPPYADFHDKETVREVVLDNVCRNQQVNDGAFAKLDEVPKTAVTMTIPAIMSAGVIVAVVPGSRKAEALKNMLMGPVVTACPASVLRRHDCCALFIDAAAAGKL